MKPKSIRAVDLFCGAGGASTGFMRACAAAGVEDVDLLAVNHWPIAVETHSLNHPHVRHKCEAVEKIDPRAEIRGGRLHLLMAGPECTHFSSARGGRPVNPQSRATAWHILKWAQELYIDTILIENVPEFRTWGPIGANHKPLKSHKGETYQAFLAALRSLGYQVEDRVLNAADYGDPTTRKRLFIMARRGRHKVRWPQPTHSKHGGRNLVGTTKKWRAAREVIDWSVKSRSIFDRRRPLKPATMARILAGLDKFGGPELRPFLVVLRNHMAGLSIDGPLPTLTATGTHVGLCEPFIVAMEHGGRLVDAGQPLPTITTAKGGAFGVVEPFLLHTTHGGRVGDLGDPFPTVTGARRGELGVVQSFVLSQQSGGAPRSVDAPLPTIATDGAISVVQPFMVPMYGERDGQAPRTHAVQDPMPTIPATGGGKFGVVEPFIVQTNERRAELVDSVEDPLRTVTATGGRCFGLAQPFLTKYNRTATGAYSVDDPIDTISTRDRFGLVQPVIDGYALDIHFRMLQPHELAAATSFPKSYVFQGTREDVVKQIGNSWPGETAKALCAAIIQDYVRVPRPTRRVA